LPVSNYRYWVQRSSPYRSHKNPWWS